MPRLKTVLLAILEVNAIQLAVFSYLLGLPGTTLFQLPLYQDKSFFVNTIGPNSISLEVPYLLYLYLWSICWLEFSLVVIAAVVCFGPKHTVSPAGPEPQVTQQQGSK